MLAASAHLGVPIAIAWHVAIVAVVIALDGGWRPTTARVRQLLSLPFLSVAVVSVASGNAFNQVAFTSLAVVFATLALAEPAEPAEPAQPGPPIFIALGCTMIAIAWVYPHFLESLHPCTYLYAAPIGVVPSPTLYLVIGFALIGPVGGRAWMAILAALGILYGVTGVALLGVRLDIGLVVGGTALVVRLVAERPLSSHASPGYDGSIVRRVL